MMIKYFLLAGLVLAHANSRIGFGQFDETTSQSIPALTNNPSMGVNFESDETSKNIAFNLVALPQIKVEYTGQINEVKRDGNAYEPFVALGFNHKSLFFQFSTQYSTANTKHYIDGVLDADIERTNTLFALGFGLRLTPKFSVGFSYASSDGKDKEKLTDESVENKFTRLYMGAAYAPNPDARFSLLLKLPYNTKMKTSTGLEGRQEIPFEIKLGGYNTWGKWQPSFEVGYTGDKDSSGDLKLTIDSYESNWGLTHLISPNINLLYNLLFNFKITELTDNGTSIADQKETTVGLSIGVDYKTSSDLILNLSLAYVGHDIIATDPSDNQESALSKAFGIITGLKYYF